MRSVQQPEQNRFGLSGEYSQRGTAGPHAGERGGGDRRQQGMAHEGSWDGGGRLRAAAMVLQAHGNLEFSGQQHL